MVEIAPWCDLTVDGTARGRPPQTLTLAPGPHHVECKNPIAHVALNRDLQLAAGETQHIKEHLYAAAHVAPHLTRADSFALDDGPPGPAARDAVPGRHRVTTFSAGREVDAAYLDIRPGGCRLLDTPELTCEKP